MLNSMRMKNTGVRMVAAIGMALLAGGVMAGNPDRAGSAGATQLLVNPWARSSGWSLANSATLRGADGMFGNVAGLAHVHKTELLFTSTRWLEGSGVKVNAVGFGQKLGESGVIGLTATAFSFGEIPVTTIDQPEGVGTFSPTQATSAWHMPRHSPTASMEACWSVWFPNPPLTCVRQRCFDAGISTLLTYGQRSLRHLP